MTDCIFALCYSGFCRLVAILGLSEQLWKRILPSLATYPERHYSVEFRRVGN